MSKRITKKEAKNALDSKIRELKERFNNGEYEYLLHKNTSHDHMQDVIHHFGGHIMKINHHLGLPQEMTRHEKDEYHRIHGAGFFGDLWSGIKKVGSTIGNVVKGVASVARPLVAPIGNLVGARFGVPGVGSIADEGLKTVGLGVQGRRRTEGGLYHVGGRYRTGGEIENPAQRTGQRRMRPDDYN